MAYRILNCSILVGVLNCNILFGLPVLFPERVKIFILIKNKVAAEYNNTP